MANENGTTDRAYYGECIEAVPFDLLVNFLGQQIPRPIAWTLVAWWRVRSFFGREITPTSGLGPVGSSTELARADMPPRPMSRWAARLEDLDDLGFTLLRFSIGDHIGAKESASALLLDESGTTFALLEWFQMPGPEGVAEQNLLELNSIFADPSLVAASSEPGLANRSPYQEFSEIMTCVMPRENLALADAFSPRFVDCLFLVDSIPLRKAVKRHQRRLQMSKLQTVSREKAIERYESLSRGRFDWMLERGLLRRLTPREVETIRQNKLPQT